MSPELFNHATSPANGTASVSVDPTSPAAYRVPHTLFGKFAEHLGWNIYHGMDAQLLFNPTMGEWPFPAGTSDSPGGGQQWANGDAVEAAIDEYTAIQEYPGSTPLKVAYTAGAAFWWHRHGPDDMVDLSPDTGPTGERAQRVETTLPATGGRAGITQWIYLPLQRTRKYDLSGRARAETESTVRVAIELTAADGSHGQVLASSEVTLGADWTELSASLTVPDSLDVGEDELFSFSITTTGDSNLVFDRILLYPDDHIAYSDPDVIEFYRDADLPLLRWPGGNFASGYHWEDGVGPRHDRPTTPNPAWGGLEYNLFGTNEFIEFCGAVGCEPMICVNAGDGTPDEAARWVEYCNGDAEETDMGALRAEHGYEEPHDVSYWELGNELHGHWQVNWTTPDGYVDRFNRFQAAMKAVDSEIEILACGNRHAYDGQWNERLLDTNRGNIDWLTDHLLVGGLITDETDRNAFCGAVTGFPKQLTAVYRDLLQATAPGEDPKVALTELQLFPRYDGEAGTNTRSLPAAWYYSRRLPDSLSFPSKKTVAEALYDATLINECIRNGDLFGIITHSATVNHGGGLQKRKERVWPDPCFYGHRMYRSVPGTRPAPVTVECATYSTNEQFGQIDPVKEMPVIDVLAVCDVDSNSRPDGEGRVLLFLIHRSANPEPIDVSIDFESAVTTTTGRQTVLAATSPAEENTVSDPDAISPTTSQIAVVDGATSLTLPPYSLTRLDVPLTP